MVAEPCWTICEHANALELCHMLSNTDQQPVFMPSLYCYPLGYCCELCLPRLNALTLIGGLEQKHNKSEHDGSDIVQLFWH